jgi:hypothetical protein
MRPISACSGRVAPSLTMSRLVTSLPRPGFATPSVLAAAAAPVPTATHAAAQALADLEARKRSVSATLRRMRCEHELLMIEQRRDRELERLHARVSRSTAKRGANRPTVAPIAESSE